MNLDQVILVDESDHEIGVMDKIEAHRGTGKLHRAISVFLFSSEGKLLIQQRSDKKFVGAGQWANTCCGNVRPGESYLECAERRLREELSIEGVNLAVVTKFAYQVKCNEMFSENELDTVFTGRSNAEVKPNPKEVSEYKWIAFDELLSQTPLAPWVQIMGERNILAKVKETYGNRK